MNLWWRLGPNHSISDPKEHYHALSCARLYLIRHVIKSLCRELLGTAAPAVIHHSDDNNNSEEAQHKDDPSDQTTFVGRFLRLYCSCHWRKKGRALQLVLLLIDSVTKTMRGCNTDETGLALADVAKNLYFLAKKKKTARTQVQVLW